MFSYFWRVAVFSPGRGAELSFATAGLPGRGGRSGATESRGTLGPVPFHQAASGAARLRGKMATKLPVENNQEV